MSINCHHSLGNFGELHVTQHVPMFFRDLRNECLSTACDATHEIGSNGIEFHPNLLKVLNQKDGNIQKLFCTKLPDGYVVHCKNGNIFSIIKDDHLVKPANERCLESENNSNIMAYSLVEPPHATQGVLPFKLLKDHDGVLPANSITNYSNVDHVIAKIASAIPLNNVPRIIYQSPPIGTLSGFNLYGNDANETKKIFLKLKSKTNGINMYNTPIALPNEICKLLTLKENGKPICIAPLINGIVGYRNRTKDDGQTLIFLANSDDFHKDTPNLGPESKVQIFKMKYNDKRGPRIFVNTRNEPFKTASCEYNTPPILLSHSVQDALNHVDYAMRKSLLKHHNIEDYPDYCQVMKLIRELQNTM